MGQSHVPVLLDRIVELMQTEVNPVFIDATLGDGGHAEALLKAGGRNSRLLGIDRDPEMLKRAQERLAPFHGQFRAAHANFTDIAEVATREGFDNASGILFDLGVASWHFDESGRGFSFQGTEPLDMRLSASLGGESAAAFINHAERQEIEDVLRTYGEEPEAGRIADAIVKRRPMTTTTQLVETIMQTKRGKTKHHPATRSFQAFRVAVNDELTAIEVALPEALQALRLGGTLAVIAYHSLEDRIVKRFMKERASQGELELLFKKPETPTDEEIVENPRARSAKLRAAVLKTQIQA